MRKSQNLNICRILKLSDRILNPQKSKITFALVCRLSIFYAITLNLNMVRERLMVFWWNSLKDTLHTSCSYCNKPFTTWWYHKITRDYSYVQRNTKDKPVRIFLITLYCPENYQASIVLIVIQDTFSNTETITWSQHATELL